jgi:predicted transcriptional regulator
MTHQYPKNHYARSFSLSIDQTLNLFDNYPTIGSKPFLAVIPGATTAAIVRLANSIGLHKLPNTIPPLFSKEQIETIFNRYPSEGATILAKDLNIPARVINRFAYSVGLHASSSNKFRKLPQSKINEILDLADKNLSRKEIADITGVGKTTVFEYLPKDKVKISRKLYDPNNAIDPVLSRINAGESVNTIANALGRSKGSIYSHLKYLGSPLKSIKVKQQFHKAFQPYPPTILSKEQILKKMGW